MKQVIAYGLQYNNETLKTAAKHYLNGSMAYDTKKEALDFLKSLRKDGSVGKREKVKLIKFVVENEK